MTTKKPPAWYTEKFCDKCGGRLKDGKPHGRHKRCVECNEMIEPGEEYKTIENPREYVHFDCGEGVSDVEAEARGLA